MHRIGGALAAILITGAAHAEADNPLRDFFQPQSAQMSPAQAEAVRRKQVVPSIRNATTCIAREVLNDAGAVQSFAATGSVFYTLPNAITRCGAELRLMMAEQDRAYGYGAGQTFFDGPYRSDIERAVLTRIRPELNRRKAEADRFEEARRAEETRLAELRRQEEERQTTLRREEDERQATARRAQIDAQQAEAGRLEAQRKLETARAEAERRTEEIRNADLKRQQLDAAEKATAVLRDRAMDCATREIAGLVRSGEAADTLANVTMTLCSGEIDKFLDGFIEQSRVRDDLRTVSPGQSTAIKAVGRSTLKDLLLAVAVKAKASQAVSTSGTGL